MKLPHLAFLLSAAALAGCGSGDADGEQLGVIEFFGDPAQIAAPSSAVVGQEFRVDVSTYGGGCVSLERTDVSIEGNVVDIRPIDRDNTEPGTACPANLATYDHSVGVVLNQPGAATIRVHGMRVAAELEEEDVWELTVDLVAPTD